MLFFRIGEINKKYNVLSGVFQIPGQKALNFIDIYETFMSWVNFEKGFKKIIMTDVSIQLSELKTFNI